MALMDVFVMPGWGEGFGAVYLQAAAMGCPIISANTTGCKDAVSDGFNGRLIEKGNVEQLKDYMEEYILNDDLRKEHGNNGMKWVQYFMPETIWSGLYQAIDRGSS
jgi:glycosyltransferase involved in cell wall biosynthesis